MLHLKLIPALVLSLAFGGADAAPSSGTGGDYGNAVAASAAQRQIVVKPGARSVQVINGETVTITVDGKSFGWHVDTYPGAGQFALAAIAPAGVPAVAVTVYVTPNPTYFGN